MESAADLPEVRYVAAVGVDVDHAVDPVGGEVPRQRLDVLPEHRRVDPHRSVELPVVGADADRDRRGTEVAAAVGGFACQRLRDHVVGPFGQVRTVLLGRPQRDQGERFGLEVLAEVRPRLGCQVHASPVGWPVSIFCRPGCRVVIDRGTVGATLKKTPDASLEIIGADGLSKKARQENDYATGRNSPSPQSTPWRAFFDTLGVRDSM